MNAKGPIIVEYSAVHQTGNPNYNFSGFISCYLYGATKNKHALNGGTLTQDQHPGVSAQIATSWLV